MIEAWRQAIDTALTTLSVEVGVAHPRIPSPLPLEVIVHAFPGRVVVTVVYVATLGDTVIEMLRIGVIDALRRADWLGNVVVEFEVG